MGSRDWIANPTESSTEKAAVKRISIIDIETLLLRYTWWLYYSSDMSDSRASAYRDKVKPFIEENQSAIDTLLNKE